MPPVSFRLASEPSRVARALAPALPSPFMHSAAPDAGHRFHVSCLQELTVPHRVSDPREKRRLAEHGLDLPAWEKMITADTKSGSESRVEWLFLPAPWNGMPCRGIGVCQPAKRQGPAPLCAPLSSAHRRQAVPLQAGNDTCHGRPPLQTPVSGCRECRPPRLRRHRGWCTCMPRWQRRASSAHESRSVRRSGRARRASCWLPRMVSGTFGPGGPRRSSR